MSIVELVVAVGIIAIIGSVVSSVTSSMSSYTSAEEARRDAQRELNQYVARFTRDIEKLDYNRLMQTSCNGQTCRVPSSPSGTVVHNQKCTAIPAKLVGLSFPTTGQAFANCSFVCPAGTQPIIEVTYPGTAGTKSYPALAQSVGGSVTNHGVGAMACFRRTTTTALSANIYFYYLQSRSQIKYLKHSLTLPTASTAGIQIMH